MDKDDEQHLKEYKSELASLKIRMPIMERLIKKIEDKND